MLGSSIASKTYSSGKPAFLRDAIAFPNSFLTLNKVLKQGNLEVLGIQEDGTWTMEIIARVIKDE